MPLKLVRDRIPERLRELGVRHRVTVADESDYHRVLVDKLLEEVEEYRLAADDEAAAEELADILEVVLALAAVRGLRSHELDRLRTDKAAARGAFAERLLVEVDDLPG